MHYIRPNRDVAKAGLKEVLAITAQFLDGSLEKLFLIPSSGKKHWKVDVDLWPGLIQVIDCDSFLSV